MSTPTKNGICQYLLGKKCSICYVIATRLNLIELCQKIDILVKNLIRPIKI